MTLNNLERIHESKFGERVNWMFVKEIINKNLEQKTRQYLVDYFWDYTIEELQDLQQLTNDKSKTTPLRKKKRGRKKATPKRLSN
jgi:hypothetical protein